MIREIRDLRALLLIVIGALLLVDIGAAALLLSPAGRSADARMAEYEQLRKERMEKTISTAPARDIEKKIAQAKEQEQTFDQERLARRYSAMSEELARIAKEAGVNVSSVHYDESVDTRKVPEGYTPLGITIQIKGSYDQDIRFINTVERQRMLLLIDGVSFGGMQGDSLTVSVHLTTYMRSQA